MRQRVASKNDKCSRDKERNITGLGGALHGNCWKEKDWFTSTIKMQKLLDLSTFFLKNCGLNFSIDQ
mgnify:CR=1 FL=1